MVALTARTYAHQTRYALSASKRLHCRRPVSISVQCSFSGYRFGHSHNHKPVVDLSKPARTRFAPSPTGYLHLGSLRTAAFNYLLAKRTGGQFLLRIEDTDEKRTVADAVERLCEGLRWAGLEWDEGPVKGGPHAPYEQSARKELYQATSDTLINTQKAFRCFCPAVEVPNDFAEPMEIGAKLGGCQNQCQNLDEPEVESRLKRRDPYVVRLRPVRPPTWSDVIYGTMRPSSTNKGNTMSSTLTDAILLKSDGSPTYHLANVVDDHAMEITHVIRGSEWMASTTLHIALYHALGWEPPQFVHVNLLTDKTGAKLSKRNFDKDIQAFAEEGVFPEALVNFLVLFGWSHLRKSDLMDMNELITVFDLKMTRGNSIVDFGKLANLQNRHFHRRLSLTIEDEKNEHLLDLPLAQIQKVGLVQEAEETMNHVMAGRDLRTYLLWILAAVGRQAKYTSPREYVDFVSMLLRSSSQPSIFHPSEEVLQTVVALMMDPEVEERFVGLSQRLNDSGTMRQVHQAYQEVNRACNDALVRSVRASLDSGSSIRDTSTISTGSTTGDVVTNVKAESQLANALARDCHDFLRCALAQKDGPAPSSFGMMIVLGLQESRKRVLQALPEDKRAKTFRDNGAIFGKQ